MNFKSSRDNEKLSVEWIEASVMKLVAALVVASVVAKEFWPKASHQMASSQLFWPYVCLKQSQWHHACHHVCY